MDCLPSMLKDSDRLDDCRRLDQKLVFGMDLEMEVAMRVDICVRDGSLPSSSDLESLSRSSTIGQELFAPELRQDELRS